MTFEQLKERHEALTMNLELMSLQTEQNSRQIAEITRQIAESAALQSDRFDKIMTGMEKLLHIAQIHQERLDRIDPLT